MLASLQGYDKTRNRTSKCSVFRKLECVILAMHICNWTLLVLTGACERGGLFMK